MRTFIAFIGASVFGYLFPMLTLACVLFVVTLLAAMIYRIVFMSKPLCLPAPQQTRIGA